LWMVIGSVLTFTSGSHEIPATSCSCAHSVLPANSDTFHY
jgi:hypothetical protein